MSRSKTEYMCLHGTSQGGVRMEAKQLPEVSEFKYLGSTLQSDGGINVEINKRTQSGWKNWKKMSGILCDKRIPERVKGKVYKTVVQPAMLYATETLPLASRHVRKLETTEMKMCRWTCGHTRKDHVRNDDIRNRLEVENISVLCKKSRLRWYGHVKRRDPGYVGRYTLEMDPPGKRKKGRPKLRWLDCVSSDLKDIGATEDDAKDKKRWKKLVSAKATPYLGAARRGRRRRDFWSIF